MALFSASNATDDEGIGTESYKRNAHDNTNNNAGDPPIAQLPLEHYSPGFEMACHMALPRT
jgi:hypothetical protein